MKIKVSFIVDEDSVEQVERDVKASLNYKHYKLIEAREDTPIEDIKSKEKDLSYLKYVATLKEEYESLVVEEYIPEAEEEILKYKAVNGGMYEVSKKGNHYCIYSIINGTHIPEAFIMTEEEFNDYTKGWELRDE